jgi:membrane fusion protein (multidrug efflux system)
VTLHRIAGLPEVSTLCRKPARVVAATVTERGADEGALVGSGAESALVSLADLSRLRLTVAVPERYAHVAARGARIAFRLERDAPDHARDATVSRTTGMLDSATRTLDVELDVDSRDGAILAGSYAEVMWPLGSDDELPWVPATALVRTSEGTCVWVKRGDSLAKVAVDELLREGGTVAVRAPLAKGELVVSRGSEDLVEGPWPGADG